jgi:hypothetical protein
MADRWLAAHGAGTGAGGSRYSTSPPAEEDQQLTALAKPKPSKEPRLPSNNRDKPEKASRCAAPAARPAPPALHCNGPAALSPAPLHRQPAGPAQHSTAQPSPAQPSPHSTGGLRQRSAVSPRLRACPQVGQDLPLRQRAPVRGVQRAARAGAGLQEALRCALHPGRRPAERRQIRARGGAHGLPVQHRRCAAGLARGRGCAGCGAQAPGSSPALPDPPPPCSCPRPQAAAPRRGARSRCT